MIQCPQCSEWFTPGTRGRPQIYCSRRCRRASWSHIRRVDNALAIRRRMASGEIQPYQKRGGMPRKSLAENLDPMIRRFFEVLEEAGVRWSWAAARAGYNTQVLSNWAHARSSPRLLILRDMLPEGYRLEIVKDGGRDSEIR